MIGLARLRFYGLALAIFSGIAVLIVALPQPGAAGTARAGQFRMDEITIISVRGRFPMVVEVAETPEARKQGLQFRKQLADGQGMLFDFGEIAPVSMWMKNTLVPLDMVFFGGDGRVTHVARDTQPLSLRVISSEGPVRGVLEVRAGTASRLGIAKGSLIDHPMFQETPQPLGSRTP